MTFAQPVFLYGLLLLPLAGLFLLWASRKRKADLARLGDPGLVERLSATVNWRGRRWRLRHTPAQSNWLPLVPALCLV